MRSMRRSTASPSSNDPPRMAGLGVVRGRPPSAGCLRLARIEATRTTMEMARVYLAPTIRAASFQGWGVGVPELYGSPWATRTIQVWAAPTGGCPLDSLPSGWVSPGQPTFRVGVPWTAYSSVATSRTSASVKPHNSAILTTALSTMSTNSLSPFRRATASIKSNRSRRSLRL